MEIGWTGKKSGVAGKCLMGEISASPKVLCALAEEKGEKEGFLKSVEACTFRNGGKDHGRKVLGTVLKNPGHQPRQGKQKTGRTSGIV